MSINTLEIKTMHRLIATGIIALNTFSVLNLSPPVKAEPKLRDCTMTIATAQKRLTTGRDVEVNIKSFDISESYPDHPDDRPMTYLLVLKGAATESIMRSPRFQKAIATEIIKSCGSVGVVTFGMDGTGWGQSVGVLPGGRVDNFECVEHLGSRGLPRKIIWGQEFCNL